MKYVVFLNGEYPIIDENYIKIIKDRILICADGGANIAYKYGLTPNYIIGDLDSIDNKILEYYKKENVNMYKYDSDKDYTDFELVLMHICGIKNINLYDRFKNEDIDFYQDKDVLVFGATGKRLDMTICKLKMLEKNKNMKYISHDNDLIYFIDSDHEINNMNNHNFSFLPSTDMKELTLKGFKYGLKKNDIEKSIGLVSNIITSNIATIEFKEGSGLIFINLKTVSK
jgi:hypothetical protein